jgi:hypothetical protein
MKHFDILNIERVKSMLDKYHIDIDKWIVLRVHNKYNGTWNIQYDTLCLFQFQCKLDDNMYHSMFADNNLKNNKYQTVP